uniref:Uncharacterized protein n=1 Tax=Calidris pygmaea TaxID=425635 RepID=A0A8C3JBE8_9CHAR
TELIQLLVKLNQFHQPVTTVLKNGAWLHGSNHRNLLWTLRNSIQYFILTFLLLTACQVKHVQKHTSRHARNSVDANVGVKECRNLWGEGAGKQGFLRSKF